MSIPSNSKCLVVGATNPTSIGFCVAQTMIRQGASHVTIVGRCATKLHQAVELLKSTKPIQGEDDEQHEAGHHHYSCACHGMVGDLKHPEELSTNDFIESAVSKMEGGLDVLVLCGGNGYSEYLGLDVDDLQSYRTMQDVLVLSPLFLAKQAIPYLSKSKMPHGGTIVMVGSVSADVPWPNTAPHNLAMASRNCMLQTLAFECRNQNVRVNGVQVGIIHTGALDAMAIRKDQTPEKYADARKHAQPLGRIGTPQDVANAVSFLASPMSGFTTGEFIRVDGGLHLSNWWNQQVMLNKHSKNMKSNTKNEE